ncbi:MAG: carboxy terminal-processing peptidase [Kiritimatiellia bacterium]
MRKFILLAVNSLILFFSVVASAESADNSVPVPQEYYNTIARKFSRALSVGHLSQRSLDDSISCQAWTNLLNSFDFDRSYFLQSDINSFTNYKFRIDNMVKTGDVSLPYEIYRLFEKRVRERYGFVTNRLQRGFDFDIDESYMFKRKNLDWPVDRKAQNELWRKRIKNDLLAMILRRELAEDSAIDKSDEAVSSTSTNAADKAESDDENKPVITPEENITKRYKQFRIIIEDMDEEAILQRYLSSVAYAFDPHTDYMSPMRKEDFDIDMNLSLCGIGASLRSEDGMAKIMEIIPGGPADRDKRDIRLIPNDRIIGVGQEDEPVESIVHLPLAKAVRKIRGEKGTKVVLEVIPASDPGGTTTKMVDLIRDEVKLEAQAATGYVSRVSLEDGKFMKVGVVKLPTFYATMDKKRGDPGFKSATEDVKNYINSFNDNNVAAMILDLRNNGGGSLREAISLTGLFISSGPAVQVRELNRIMVLSVPNTRIAFRRPVAVLINRASASASEIVAAALQDYGRAVIIGDSKSHGKGTVQTVLPLGAEKYGSLKLTTASFYRINGASTQRKGVQSDVVIPSRLEGLEIGEEKLPNSLPWSEVEPARYMPVFDMSEFLTELRRLSAERLADNEEYSRYCKMVESFRKATERKELPLLKSERRKMMEEEKAMRDLYDTDQMTSEEDRQTPEMEINSDEDDIVLTESKYILADFVNLTGGGDMELEGDIRSRVMRIFGAAGR